MTIINGESFGKYKILSEIGKGGMGEVYLAQDTNLNRKVAIKFLSEEFSKDSEKLNRFIQEAQATSALNHPNILTVYEIDEAEGKRYIATEYIEGETLRNSLGRKEYITLNRILKIAIQVSEALSAAHAAGIIHRDIKPENIMIRKDGYAKVLDFGIAKLTGKKDVKDVSLDSETKALVKTSPGMAMGTVSYMSPEQARGKETDARTDIWSLGVVLYEMLAGKVPFKGETTNHTVVSILEKEPILLENVPHQLQRIIDKALTKERGMRYQTAKDFLIDLKNLRRELVLQVELERSVTPDREETDTGGERDTHIHDQKSIEETDPAATGLDTHPETRVTSASSLEYAVEQAKSHKLYPVVAAMLLLGAISAIAYFEFFTDTDTRQIRSIAVMPFVNESGNKDVEYLADGIAETLISGLSQIPNLSVKARSSVFRYKGKEIEPKKIGEELNVEVILIGRVIQRGEDLVLNLELVDVQTENILWAEKYNRKMSNLVALQTEIARNVSEKLQLKLSGEDEKKLTKTYTANAEAYQAYLKGRFYWNKRTEEIKKSIEFFNEAIELDPNYALAWSGLADTYLLLPEYTETPTLEALPKAKSMAEKAIELDPELAEARTSLASILNDLRDFSGADREFQTAIRLNPKYATAHQWYSYLLSMLGKHNEAISEAKIAQRLDPPSKVININLGERLFIARRFDEAIQQYQRTVEMFPEYARGHGWLAASLAHLGKYTEAISECNKAIELGDRSDRLYLAYVYAKSGKKSEAYKILDENIQDTEYDVYVKAIIYALLNDKDRAFQVVEKLNQDKFSYVLFIKTEPGFDNLRNDPRYKELLRKMGLPE